MIPLPARSKESFGALVLFLIVDIPLAFETLLFGGNKLFLFPI
jgi:hypothetical protein